MKFGFKLGKSKDKEAPQEEAGTEEAGAEVVDELLQEVEEVPARPHPPIQELSLENAGGVGGPDAISVDEAGVAAEEEGEPVKLVEVQPETVAQAAPEPIPPPVQAAQSTNPNDAPMDLNMSIGNIFNNLEEEENPLVNLIRSLPDVAATELIDDLKEINDIIKDWQKK